MTKNVNDSRRKFIKTAIAGGGALGIQASASPIISNSLLNDDQPKMSASHWGAFRAYERNGRFEALKEFEKDFHPVTLLEGTLARTYASTRIKAPCVRKSYLEKGYKSDTSLRGKEEFVEISWDEAYKLVADELKRVYKDYGERAVFGGSYGWFCVGSINNPQALLGRMLNIAGGYTTRTLTYSTHAIRAISPYITGIDETNTIQTSLDNVISDSECVVFWSCDPINTNQIAWGVPDHQSYEYYKKLKQEAKKRKIEFISIDPVYNNTAMYFGSKHIAVNPTTDVALMLGISNYLITNNLYDAKFVKKYTYGFDEFKKYVLGEGEDKVAKTTEWASKITGVSKDEIETLAKLISSKKTMLMGGWGWQRADHGEQPIWMMITLAALLGQIGTKGGGYGLNYHYSDGGVPSPGAPSGNPLSDGGLNGSQGMVTTGVPAFPGLSGISVATSVDGPWKSREALAIPVSRIVECLENPNKEIDFNGSKVTYPELKLAYWAGGNPFVHHQDTNRMRKAWEKLDTFIVQDPFWTPSAKMADIVLPATVEQEREDITKSHTNKFIFAMHQIVEPFASSKSDYEIFQGILKQFGEKEVQAFTEGRTTRQWIEHFYNTSKQKADETGIKMPTFDEFWKVGYAEFMVPESAKETVKMSDFISQPIVKRLGTPSGKIDIKSRKIEKFNYPNCKAIPTWFEPEEWLGSKKISKYPLNLVTPHPKYRLHTQLDNTFLRDFQEIDGRVPMWINPEDAKKRGLKSGDIVRVFNDRGEILAGVVVTEFIKNGVVRIEEGAWWDPNKDGLDVHGNPNVLVMDRGTSFLAQGNQATALVEVEKWDKPLPEITVFDAPKVVNKG